MANEAKHTPGPWVTRGHSDWYVSKDDSDQTSTWGVGPKDERFDPVAIVVHEGNYEDKTYTANAHLIAASPDMFAALIAIKEAAADMQKAKSAIVRNRYAADIVRWSDAAISKSTGAA